MHDIVANSTDQRRSLNLFHRKRGVAGVRDGECFGRAVVGDGEAKKFGGDGMGFSVVKGRQTRDKKVEVGAKRVFDAKVVND